MQKADSPSHSHEWYLTSSPRSSALHLACSTDLPEPLISHLQHHHPREVRRLWNWSITEEDRTSWKETRERKIFVFLAIRAKGKKHWTHILQQQNTEDRHLRRKQCAGHRPPVWLSRQFGDSSLGTTSKDLNCFHLIVVLCGGDRGGLLARRGLKFPGIKKIHRLLDHLVPFTHLECYT